MTLIIESAYHKRLVIKLVVHLEVKKVVHNQLNDCI